MDKNTASEWVLIGVPAGALSMVGYVGHVLAYSSKKVTARRFTGGVMFAGFAGWVAYSIIAHTGVHPEVAAPIASIIGASGDRGFELLFRYAKGQLGGE